MKKSSETNSKKATNFGFSVFTQSGRSGNYFQAEFATKL